MTKIDIFSGFLGAGKTTLIKKLIQEAYAGEELVLIENEFGQIGIDGGFLEEAGIRINEMNSGCICCSLVGDFSKALAQVLADYHPDRILIEPSGVGKLSDVVRAVSGVLSENVRLGALVAVVDAAKCKMYGKNFGEFFFDQIETASTVILSHQGKLSEDKLAAAVAIIREHNESATLVTTPWEALDGKSILAAMERTDTMEEELARLLHEQKHHHHHHDHDECDDPDCDCHHHHHHDDEDEDEHEHHHHHDHDDEDEDEHEHHHHHHHDDDDEDEHEHHHHHHDDDDDDEHEHHHHHHHDDEDDDEHEHHHHHHHDHDDDDDDEHEHHHHHHHDDEDEDEHEHHHHHHHHHDECDDPDCDCHHHHDHDDEHGHHHHHDGEECDDPNCTCHHHHHADEVFRALGAESEKCYTEEALADILEALAEDTGAYGLILRAKGIVPVGDGRWLHFDYVPGEADIRYGTAAVTGRLCVIGSNVNKTALEALFGVELRG